MPDPKLWIVGDRIRILRVPEDDLRRRVQDIETGSALPGITADSIERIIHQAPVVPICRVDEDGYVWYETTIIGADGIEEQHSLIVYDDETWEEIDKSISSLKDG